MLSKKEWPQVMTKRDKVSSGQNNFRSSLEELFCDRFIKFINLIKIPVSVSLNTHVTAQMWHRAISISWIKKKKPARKSFPSWSGRLHINPKQKRNNRPRCGRGMHEEKIQEASEWLLTFRGVESVEQECDESERWCLRSTVDVDGISARVQKKSKKVPAGRRRRRIRSSGACVGRVPRAVN
jgi:hypothetical protein